MAHAINNDTDFFAVVNETRGEPWHRLGQRVEKAVTAEEALKLANLDWDVKLVPVFAFVGSTEDETAPLTDDDALFVPGKWASVAWNTETKQPIETLGIVGERFTPTPNRQLFAFMDGIVGNVGGAHYDTAGYIRPLNRHGQQMAQVFITIDLGDAGNVVLDPNGAHDSLSCKLYATAGHDGSLALTTGISETRIVCANTQAAALGNSKAKFRIKHTRNLGERMDQARSALGLVLTEIEAMHEAAEKLVIQSYTDKEFQKLVETVFPQPKDDAATGTLTRYEKQRESMTWLWKAGPHNDNIRGTKWCALQSVVEYLDYFKPVKGNTLEMNRRAVQAITGEHDNRKQRTLQLLLG